MKTHLSFFIFILFQSMLFAQNEPTAKKYPVVKKSEIKKFKIKKGIFDHSFKMTDHEKWDMKISIPEIQSDEKVPLIIALHWAGGGKTYQEFMDCLVTPAADSLNAIIIAPSANHKHWAEPMYEKRVVKLIKQVKKYWPVDPKKIVVLGYSNGGIGTWEYAKKHPKLFCAAIPIAGYYSPSKMEVPIFVIHGTQDELFNKKEVAIALEKSIGMGSKIETEFIPKFSHYMACDYKEVLKQKLHKVKTEIWEKEN